MNKTIVSIISEQTSPNYIFIREKYQDGDKLLFISSQRFKSKIDVLMSVLNYQCPVQEIILCGEGDEENWSSMTEQITAQIDRQETYLVNLTGGTKYMAMAVKTAFEQAPLSEFCYIPLPKNLIISPNYANSVSLQYRMTIKEYFGLYGLSTTASKKLTQSKETSETMLSLFLNDYFRNEEKSRVLSLLRKYRDNNVNIATVETCEGTAEDKKPQIVGLSAFLSDLAKVSGFVQKDPLRLSKYETQYITGGWFEEYVYTLIQEKIQPTDIQLGLLVRRKGDSFEQNKNDLDVVFTKGNKLFVIECKTGVPTNGVSAFKEIVYKATALKESLFKMPAKSFIFALTTPEKTDDFRKTAQYMQIDFYDQTVFTDMQQTMRLIQNINTFAND